MVITLTECKTAYSDNLPHESKNEMFFPSMQVLRANVDNITANSLSRVQCQRQVLMNLINAQFSSSVDSSLVNRARL